MWDWQLKIQQHETHTFLLKCKMHNFCYNTKLTTSNATSSNCNNVKQTKCYKMTRHKVCIMFLLDNDINLHVFNKDRKLHVLDKYTKFCIKLLLNNDQKLLSLTKTKAFMFFFLPLNLKPYSMDVNHIQLSIYCN